MDNFDDLLLNKHIDKRIDITINQDSFPENTNFDEIASKIEKSIDILLDPFI